MDDGITIGVVEIGQDPLLKFDEVHLAVRKARRRYPGRTLTGALVFPDSPKDADSWNRMKAAGFPPETMEKGLAFLKSQDPSAAGQGRNHSAASGLVAASSQVGPGIAVSRNKPATMLPRGVKAVG